MAPEHGDIELLRFLTNRDTVLLISIGPARKERFQSSNVTPSSGSEVNHSTQGIVVIQGRGRSSNDFDTAHKPRIMNVEPREAVGLGLDEPVFVDLDISNREGRLGALTADHHTEVPRPIGLPQHNTRK